MTWPELEALPQSELDDLKLAQKVCMENAARLSLHPQTAQRCKVCGHKRQKRFGLRIVQQVQGRVKRYLQGRLLGYMARLRVLIARHRAI